MYVEFVTNLSERGKIVDINNHLSSENYEIYIFLRNKVIPSFVESLNLNHTYLIYEQLDFEVITGSFSEAYGRTIQRFREALQTIDLIRQIMKKMPKTGAFFTRLPNVLNWKIPAGETYVRAEATRGEYGYYMVADGSEYPRRVYVRGPGYTHAIALLQKLAVNTNIADIAGLMVSLHTCPPEIEK